MHNPNPDLLSFELKLAHLLPLLWRTLTPFLSAFQLEARPEHVDRRTGNTRDGASRTAE